MKDRTKLLAGAALGGMLLAATHFSTAYAASGTATASGGGAQMGECHGVNSCKGTGDCGGKGHGCAGKNTCKGQGWQKMSEADCEAKGGEFKAG